jgi:hypothetical protein
MPERMTEKEIKEMHDRLLERYMQIRDVGFNDQGWALIFKAQINTCREILGQDNFLNYSTQEAPGGP